MYLWGDFQNVREGSGGFQSPAEPSCFSVSSLPGHAAHPEQDPGHGPCFPTLTRPPRGLPRGAGLVAHGRGPVTLALGVFRSLGH